MRGLVLGYAAQHALAEADTGLVGIGWTGRMAASLIGMCEAAGMTRPHILFWGHESRPATRWTDPERVGSHVCNTATGHGLAWRVPDAPFLWRRSAWAATASSPGTVRTPAGGSSPCCYHLATTRLKRGASVVPADALRVLRGARYGPHAARRRRAAAGAPGHGRLLVPPEPSRSTRVGAYPYDSDPAGTAVRPLARPFEVQERVTRGSRVAGGIACLEHGTGQGSLTAPGSGERARWCPETDGFYQSVRSLALVALSMFGADPTGPWPP